MAGQNIDITNKSDPFFTDICFPYTTKYNTDITLKDKKDTYNIDPDKFCDSQCRFIRFNFTTNIVICNCTLIPIKAPSLRSIEQKEQSFFTSIEVATCHKLILNKEIFSKNIGNWFLIKLIKIQILILIVFLVNGLSSLLRYFMKIFYKAKQVFDKKLRHNSNKNSERLSLTNIKQQSYNEDKTISPQLNDAMTVKTNYFNENDHLASCQNITMTNEELNDLDYYPYAISLDKRSFVEHYWSILLINQSLLSTFFNINNKRAKTIKLAIFSFTITMILGTNALFYSEKYVINSHQSRGNFNFVYHFFKSFISYLCVIAIKQLLLLLIYNDKDIKDIKSERSPYKILIKTNFFMKRYKIQLCAYLILQFIIVFASWYYVIAFCAVYKNNQVHWFIGSLITFALEMLIPLISSLLIALSKYTSIKYQKKNLYFVSSFAINNIG